MKKKFATMLFLIALFFTVSLSASAQIIYVKIRPPVPVIVRPPQPSPAYIWVNEEWEPEGNSYKYSGGHWVSPPQAGYYRRPGYWRSSKQGQIWVKGDWYEKQHTNNGKHKGQYKNKHKDKD